VLLTVSGSNFDVAPESHLEDISMALGVAPDDLEVVDTDTDGRTGTLVTLPTNVVVPTPEQLRRSRIRELEKIPRSEWTTAQMRELIQLLAQEINGG